MTRRAARTVSPHTSSQQTSLKPKSKHPSPYPYKPCVYTRDFTTTTYETSTCTPTSRTSHHTPTHTNRKQELKLSTDFCTLF